MKEKMKMVMKILQVLGIPYQIQIIHIIKKIIKKWLKVKQVNNNLHMNQNQKAKE